MEVRIMNKYSSVFVFLCLFSFVAFGKEKVLDLGALEITGEVRRPNVKLVYSKKKYFNKALSTIAKEELRVFEKELLQPAKESNIKKANKTKAKK